MVKLRRVSSGKNMTAKPVQQDKGCTGFIFELYLGYQLINIKGMQNKKDIIFKLNARCREGDWRFTLNCLF